MGCSSSSNIEQNSNDKNRMNQIIKTNAKCTLTLYDGGNSIKPSHIVGSDFKYNIKYSYGSQRGFYPDGMVLLYVLLLYILLLYCNSIVLCC